VRVLFCLVFVALCAVLVSAGITWDTWQYWAIILCAVLISILSAIMTE
jgi:uncharacterized membrane protein YvlD (DUF360 family)